MKKLTNIALATAFAVALSGCNIYKKYETPATTPVTAAYVEAKADSVAAMPSFTPWQSIYTDPVLADLIERACSANTNLRNAQLNVEAARAQLQGARLSYLPSVALAPAYNGSKLGSGDISWSYQLPAQVSWEVDVFGKLLTSNRKAKAALQQSEAYCQAVRSQIIAAVATTYYSLGAVRGQLELSRNTSQLWLETVNKLRDLKLAGRTTEAAVMQSEASYYGILASITDLEASEHKLNNTMSLLLGTMPQRWEVNENIGTITPPSVLNADGSVPMALLGARPDVEASERALALAYYNTVAARQAFYPNLNITANGGFTNLLGAVVSNPAHFFLQLSGQLAAPIFSRGRNIATLKASKAAQQQALNNFEYALMNAAAEVSDAITVYEKSNAKVALLDRQVEDLSKAVSMTQDLFTYSNGDVNYLNVITAQQSLLQAQISKISSTLAANLAVVNLYQAIGAGR